MRSKQKNIFRRIFTFICAMVLVVHVVLPAAAVSASYDTAEINVVTDKNSATYFYRTTDNFSVIYLNTATGIGSFAVIYADSPMNVYDLTFSTDPTQSLSAVFWQELKDDCFARIHSVEPIYIPDAISSQPAELAQSAANTRSADINYFRSKLVNVYGTEHADQIIRTSVVNGVLFEQKEGEYIKGHTANYIMVKSKDNVKENQIRKNQNLVMLLISSLMVVLV